MFDLYRFLDVINIKKYLFTLLKMAFYYVTEYKQKDRERITFKVINSLSFAAPSKSMDGRKEFHPLMSQ